MARPKKLSTDDLLRVVDAYYESNGDAGRLKFSLLSEYAGSLGLSIEAYDFRRDAAVRQRIEELRGGAHRSHQCAVAYKSLDIDALLGRSYSREALKTSLLELDESWRRVYERAAELSAKNAALLKETLSNSQTIKALNEEKESLTGTIQSLRRESNALAVENSYYRQSLRKFLYPNVANEILKSEGVLEQVDTEVTEAAMSSLADMGTPVSLPASVEHDRRILSREEALLLRMTQRIGGGNNGTKQTGD